MPDFGEDDPLSAAVRGRGGLYNLSTASQPGQGGLDRPQYQSQLDPISTLRQQRESIAQQLQLSNNSRHQQRQLFGALGAINSQERSYQAQAALEQRQRAHEASLARQMAHDSSQEYYHQLSTDRDTAIDEHGAAALQGMLQLDGALRRGEISKDQYDNGLLDIGQRYPLMSRHPEAARHFEFAIDQADKTNAYNARRELTQAAKLGAKYGIEPQVDPETGRPSIELTQQAALFTPKGKNEALGQMNREMAQKYGVPTGVSSLFNPITPHTSDDENQTINLPFTDPKAEGGIGKLKVPTPLFNQMKSDFNDRYFALNPQTQAQPAGAALGPQSNAAPADPRMALAQKALEDPNASEEHKAAAKRILGQE